MLIAVTVMALATVGSFLFGLSAFEQLSLIVVTSYQTVRATAASQSISTSRNQPSETDSIGVDGQGLRIPSGILQRRD